MDILNHHIFLEESDNPRLYQTAKVARNQTIIRMVAGDFCATFMRQTIEKPNKSGGRRAQIEDLPLPPRTVLRFKHIFRRLQSRMRGGSEM